MDIQTFNDKAVKWMAEHGFTPTVRAADGRSITFTSTTNTGVAISCVLTGDTAHAEVSGVADWQFLRVTTGRIQFEHSRIVEFIDAVQDLIIVSGDAYTRIKHRKAVEEWKAKVNSNG